MPDLSLETVLEKIWEQRVVQLYQKGKIQTERHLQGYIFMWLKETLAREPQSEWDVWVEPQFYFVDENPESFEKMYKPDIVVTKGTEIAGFIELKFSPQQHNMEKNLQSAIGDIDKLAKYCCGLSTLPEIGKAIVKPTPTKQNGNYFFLEIDPQAGSYLEPAYQRTPNTIYEFFGVARYGNEARDKLLNRDSIATKQKSKNIIKLLETKR